MSSYRRKSLEAFCADLSSANGAPGGGAAAALTGVLGVSLLEMTTRINDRRLRESSSAALRSTARLRKNLLSLMDEDAAAFTKIEKLYKSKQKGTAWQRALKGGANAPLRMTKALAEAADLVADQRPRTGKWLLSDLREAALLLNAAYEAACLNVEINLRAITDKTFNASTRRDLADRSRILRKARSAAECKEAA